ncbi:MAG: site-2 protease family protein [Patescibacteria group bacterium]
MTVIIFLIVLGILIFSHELGHFLAAKRAGVRVDEFGLGFPPRLIGWRRGGTLYSLNIIPFGGFVKIYGEDPEEVKTDSSSSVSLIAKSKWTQALILAAGIVFNLLLAWLLLTVALSTTGLPLSAEAVPTGYQIRNPQLTVVQVAPDSPAAKAGLKPGDVVVSLRAGAEAIAPTTAPEVQNFTANRADQEITIGFIQPAAKQKTFITERAVTPALGLTPGRAAIGLGLDVVGQLKLSLPRAIVAGGQMFAKLTFLTAQGLIKLVADLFRGEKQLLNQVVGPIGLASLVGTASNLGFGYLLFFIAVISINLALLNLLPLPALDGGRLLFLLIEAIKGSPIKPPAVHWLNLAGFAMLILLMIFVTYHDLQKFIF